MFDLRDFAVMHYYLHYAIAQCFDFGLNDAEPRLREWLRCPGGRAHGGFCFWSSGAHGLTLVKKTCAGWIAECLMKISMGAKAVVSQSKCKVNLVIFSNLVEICFLLIIIKL
jgi:hypothetical protein